MPILIGNGIRIGGAVNMGKAIGASLLINGVCITAKSLNTQSQFIK
jgi:hypothetical protein